MQSFIFVSSIDWNFIISSPSILCGIKIGSLQVNILLEKGYVIKNESQEFNEKLLDDQYPTGIIGILEVFAILIIPSDTFSLGPLGPSGVMPI